MKNIISITELRTLAYAALCLTVKELFPRAEMRGGGATSLGFYADFAGFVSWDKEVLRILEERMLALVRGKEEAIFREMVPFSACEYFRLQKERFFCDALQVVDAQTVKLLAIKGKMFWVPHSVPSSSLEVLRWVRLLGTEKAPDGGVRVLGEVFSSRDAQKEFFRKWTGSFGVSHEILGGNLGKHFPGEGVLFLPSGQKALVALEALSLRVWEEVGGSVISSRCVGKKNISWYQQAASVVGKSWVGEVLRVEKEGVIGAGEGWFSLPVYQSGMGYIFCKENLLRSEVISCLHFVTKIFKILGFAWDVFLVERRKGKSSVLRESLSACADVSWQEELGEENSIEIRIADRIGRGWSVARIQAPCKVKMREESGSPLYGIPVVWVVSLERILGLLVEHGKIGVLF